MKLLSTLISKTSFCLKNPRMAEDFLDIQKSLRLVEKN